MPKHHVSRTGKRSRLFRVFRSKPETPKQQERLPSTRTQRHGNMTWVDIQDPANGSLAGAVKDFNLHAIHASKSLAVSHIARVEVETDYIFILLHFPYLNKANDKISTLQMMIFLGNNFLATVHARELTTVRELFEVYEHKSTDETKSSARILLHLISESLVNVDQLIQTISIELDELEDKVFDEETSDARPITHLRHKIMSLRRTLATQINVLEDLEATIDKFTGEHLERYYRANTNRCRKLWETIEEARETVEIYKDADFTSSQERTNDILAILTIIFTLGIPATVLGTFYGMNILLPGGIETGSWAFFGRYTTLIVVLVASITPAIAMYIYFKKKKWF